MHDINMSRTKTLTSCIILYKMRIHHKDQVDMFFR